MVAAIGLYLDFSYRAHILEGLINLVIQFLAISDDKKCPVAWDFAQHFLREEDHRIAFATALRMPEHAQASLVLAYRAHGFQSIVDTQKLVVFGDEFDRSATSAAKQSEIFYDIQQTVLFAGTANHRFERDDTLFLLVADLLPLEEMFPASRHAADPALMPVRENNERVIPEDLWNGILVIAQVIVISIFNTLMRCLQFDKNQGKSVHKAHQVGPFPVHLSRNPELRRQKEVIIRGVVPVNDAHRLDNFCFFTGADANRNTLLE